MVTIDSTNGRTIENTLVFAPETPQKDKINLTRECGDDMRYHKIDYALVDYPGEYDMDGVLIHCFLGTGNKLSYFIQYHGEKITLLQTADVLENNTELASANIFLYTDETLINKLDQLELEGERIKLG